MNDKIRERAEKIKKPEKIGSYKKDDCIFLLTNINGKIKEQENEEREKLIQNGIHYSEMLPVEYIPKDEYMEVFHKTLNDSAHNIATLVAITAEKIIHTKKKNVILVSLARAGTPVGVLIKRYLKYKYNLNVPHYSVSIIRGKGIDENAICYILNKHNSNNIQFIDGWTGKGAINNVLDKAMDDFYKKYGVKISKDLAVLADPAQCVKIFGTREDILIPSACLNSTVSGLISRTVERKDLIGEYDFHGAKFYEEWKDIDLSNYFVDKISKEFKNIDQSYVEYMFIETTNSYVLNTGIKEVKQIQKDFGIDDINMVKPGIGETTRVLLRRIPWKILVDDINNPNLKHIILLAKDRNVPVIEYKKMNYSCCGLIKTVK